MFLTKLSNSGMSLSTVSRAAVMGSSDFLRSGNSFATTTGSRVKGRVSVPRLVNWNPAF